MPSISFISQGLPAVRAVQAGGMSRIAIASTAQADPSFAATEFDPLAASLDATIASSINESLISLQGRLDPSVAASNALATAAGAIMQIGNVIGTIQNVLGQPGGSSPAESVSNTADSQSTIDAALNSLDSISGSSRFLGRLLLSGTYVSAGQSIPSLTTQTLGTASPNGTVDPNATLGTLLAGGPNDLSSGNLSQATSIANSAAQQVGSVSQLVDSLRAVAVGAALLGVESGPPGIDAERTPNLAAAMNLAAQAKTMMFADPQYSDAAVANAPAAHVLAMI